MMGPHFTDWIQAAAALLTMLAAFAALIIAAKAPRWAAKFAEEYRQQNAAKEELQRFRMGVFSTLMAHRSEILAREARTAINLVDVAFAGVPGVRSARRLFIDATTSGSSTNIVERYHALIEAVAREMDASEHLDGFDVRLGYYPIAAGKIDEAALIEAEEKIAKRAGAEEERRLLS